MLPHLFPYIFHAFLISSHCVFIYYPGLAVDTRPCFPAQCCVFLLSLTKLFIEECHKHSAIRLVRTVATFHIFHGRSHRGMIPVLWTLPHSRGRLACSSRRQLPRKDPLRHSLVFFAALKILLVVLCFVSPIFSGSFILAARMVLALSGVMLNATLISIDQFSFPSTIPSASSREIHVLSHVAWAYIVLLCALRSLSSSWFRSQAIILSVFFT